MSRLVPDVRRRIDILKAQGLGRTRIASVLGLTDGLVVNYMYSDECNRNVGVLKEAMRKELEKKGVETARLVADEILSLRYERVKVEDEYEFSDKEKFSSKMALSSESRGWVKMYGDLRGDFVKKIEVAHKRDFASELSNVIEVKNENDEGDIRDGEEVKKVE